MCEKLGMKVITLVLKTRNIVSVKWLTRRQFGDPILRKHAKRVAKRDIRTEKIQKLIANMQHTLTSLELGVGLAAPQVGHSLAIVVINIQPLPHRPLAIPFEAVMINPKITKIIGKQKQLWESCISSGDGQPGFFAKAARYPKLEVEYQDEYGKLHKEKFSGLPAHVIQHEVDHLNGILFVDHVTNPKTFMTYRQYVEQIVKSPGR